MTILMCDVDSIRRRYGCATPWRGRRCVCEKQARSAMTTVRYFRRKADVGVLNGALLASLCLLCYVTLIHHNGVANVSKDEFLSPETLLERPLPQRSNTGLPQHHGEGAEREEFKRRVLLSVPRGRSMSLREHSLRFVVLEENLQSAKGTPGDPDYRWVLTERSTVYDRMFYVRLHNDLPSVVEKNSYLKRYPKSLRLRLGDVNDSHWEPVTRQLDRVADYFDYLHTMQGHCRKLVRLGGALACKNVGDDRYMDGQKLVCFDPELELLGSRDPSSCLVFSYGVSVDITFDDGIAFLPCEIHMFDKLDFTPSAFLKDNPHAHFHQVGLSDTYQVEFYTRFNRSFMMDTLVNQVIKYNLIGRPMHILKIDIENAEWKVLKALKDDSFLHVVGQIALEVHAAELYNMTLSEQLQYVQHRYEILRSIESRGFRMVAYWDNHQKKAYYDEHGGRHDLCGEMLYVNTNWYNSSFKAILRDE